jgi:hypothetical protein
MIAACYSNSAFNETTELQEARNEMVQDIRADCDRAVRWLRTGEKQTPEEQDADYQYENDPLFRQARRMQQPNIAMPNAGRADEMIEAGRRLQVVE